MARQADTPATAVVCRPAAAGPDRPSFLMVMPLRAAEQHVLVVVGEADLHTAGQLRTALIDMLDVEPPSLVVELGALQFCDLSGLDALHDAARAAHDADVPLTFRGMSRQLSWLHATFPPRTTPQPPALASAGPETQPGGDPEAPAPPDPGRPVQTPSASSPAAGTLPGDGASRSAAHLSDEQRWAGRRIGGELRGEFRTGRGGGRRGAPDQLVHAVPAGDTTRSAVCGARVRPAGQPWTGAEPQGCPECSLLLAPTVIASVHALAAPQAAAAAPHRQNRTAARRVS